MKNRTMSTGLVVSAVQRGL